MSFISKILVKARRKLGISGREFARRLGVSKSAYFRYEKGERKPPVEVVKKCCRILGIPFYFRRAEDGLNNRQNLIGRKISLLRRIKFMPLKALSLRSGISYSRCYDIEAGRIVPTRKEISKIAKALGVSPTIFRKENFVKFLLKYKNLFSEL